MRYLVEKMASNTGKLNINLTQFGLFWLEKYGVDSKLKSAQVKKNNPTLDYNIYIPFGTVYTQKDAFIGRGFNS